MKKTYETPEVEVVKFQYRDQVVVASGNTCSITDVRGENKCIRENPTSTHYSTLYKATCWFISVNR